MRRGGALLRPPARPVLIRDVRRSPAGQYDAIKGDVLCHFCISCHITTVDSQITVRKTNSRLIKWRFCDTFVFARLVFRTLLPVTGTGLTEERSSATFPRLCTDTFCQSARCPQVEPRRTQHTLAACVEPLPRHMWRKFPESLTNKHLTLLLFPRRV